MEHAETCQRSTEPGENLNSNLCLPLARVGEMCKAKTTRRRELVFLALHNFAPIPSQYSYSECSRRCHRRLLLCAISNVGSEFVDGEPRRTHTTPLIVARERHFLRVSFVLRQMLIGGDSACTLGSSIIFRRPFPASNSIAERRRGNFPTQTISERVSFTHAHSEVDSFQVFAFSM